MSNSLEVLSMLLLAFNPVGFQNVGAGHGHGSLKGPKRSRYISMHAVDEANDTLVAAMSTSWPEVAVNSLKKDLSDILAREPNWEYFAKNFKLIDQTGITLKGLAPNIVLLKLLQEVHLKLIKTQFMDNFEVVTERKLDESSDGSLESILTAQWSFIIRTALDMPTLQELKNVYFPLLPYIQVLELEHQMLPASDAFPLQVAAASTIRFNPDGKVVSLKVDSWSINGNKVESSKFPSSEQLPDLEKWLCQKIVKPKQPMEDQTPGLDWQPSREHNLLEDKKSVNISSRFPTFQTSPVEVLQAQLDALASGNISQIFKLFSRARRQIIEESARLSPRQIKVEPERVREALRDMLRYNCRGLVGHRLSELLSSHGDPEPHDGFLPSWTYRVRIDGAKLFVFTLTQAPRGQFGFDGGHPEATRSDYDGVIPGDPVSRERCWLVWDITKEDDGGNRPVDVPESPERQPVLA